MVARRPVLPAEADRGIERRLAPTRLFGLNVPVQQPLSSSVNRVTCQTSVAQFAAWRRRANFRTLSN